MIIITYNFLLGQVPVNLDSLFKEDSETPISQENRLMNGIEQVFLDHNHNTTIKKS